MTGGKKECSHLFRATSAIYLPIVAAFPCISLHKPTFLIQKEVYPPPPPVFYNRIPESQRVKEELTGKKRDTRSVNSLSHSPLTTHH